MNTAGLGKLDLSKIIWVLVPAMIVTPLYTYHMAVSKKEEPPYPHATVTSTACHYPQDIVFRYVMLINSSFLALIFFVIFRWVEQQASRVGYPVPPKYQFYLAMGSILCYGVTIGTIDGKDTGPLHGPCAVIFFVVEMAIILNITVFITRLRAWDTTVISKTSLHLKQALAAYVAGVWLWCIYYMVQESTSGPNRQDIYVVIIEWNSVLINLLWLLTFVCEWRHFKLALNQPSSV